MHKVIQSNIEKYEKYDEKCYIQWYQIIKTLNF